jgi:hypothetical protein
MRAHSGEHPLDAVDVVPFVLIEGVTMEKCVALAKETPAAVRHSSGGFHYVKAMGLKLEDRGIVQVSMNLTNYEKTPMFPVFEAVKAEAAGYGVNVQESGSSAPFRRLPCTRPPSTSCRFRLFREGRFLRRSCAAHLTPQNTRFIRKPAPVPSAFWQSVRQETVSARAETPLAGEVGAGRAALSSC